MYKHIVACIMSMSIIFLISADVTYSYGQLEGFIAQCITNSQLVFGVNQNFAALYCEDVYTGTTNVISAAERDEHIDYWTAFYASSIGSGSGSSPLSSSPGSGILDTPSLDIERMHDDWICSLDNPDLTPIKPSFREYC